jgi:hypothetical protein
MREREEVYAEFGIEAEYSGVRELADEIVTLRHTVLAERDVIGQQSDEIVRLREAIANHPETPESSTRVTDEMVERVVEAAKRVIDADTDVLQAVAIVMLREAFAAETQGDTDA